MHHPHWQSAERYTMFVGTNQSDFNYSEPSQNFDKEIMTRSEGKGDEEADDLFALRRNASPHDGKIKGATQRRRVTFNESVHIRHTISIDDMSQEEITSTWMSDFEHKLVRLSCRYLIGKMESGEDVSEEERQGFRGLETQVGTRARIKKMSRISALNAVMEEQWRQHQLGRVYYCGEDLGRTHSEINTLSLKLAHMTGINDQEIAASIYTDY